MFKKKKKKKLPPHRWSAKDVVLSLLRDRGSAGSRGEYHVVGLTQAVAEVVQHVEQH